MNRMADEVLEILRAIQGDIAGLKADMMTVMTELRVHSETFDVLLREGRMLRGAVSDSARRSVARGEMEAIHQDLNRLRHEMSALTVRIDMIEEREKSEQ
jgi:ubiquinone biosynthesis protein UbiJ